MTEDRLAQALYERMHATGESLAEASAELGLTGTEPSLAQDRLVRLGLLTPDSRLTVDTPVALSLALERSHRALDTLVQQHVLASSLARNYLGLARRAQDDTLVEFYPREHGDRLGQRLDELAEMARDEVSAMHPATTWAPARLRDADERNRISHRRGVRVRGMHAQVMLANPRMRDYLRSQVEHGVEVRVSPVIPTRVLIYDRRVAIIQADPENLDAGAVLVQGADVVRSLSAIYDYLWMTASEPEDVPRTTDGITLTEQQRAVLRMLASGAKDDAIARHLGVSTRTVTRLVGELSTMLGAGSRFQAGVRAARLGWLD